MFGKEYITQHVLQTIQEEQKETLYRAYLTEALRIIGENTAALSSNGKYIEPSWADIVNPPPEEHRTAEEIIEHITAKIASL